MRSTRYVRVACRSVAASEEIPYLADTGRSSVYMDSPGLSSWTNVSALFRSGGGAGLHAVLATPGAVIGSSQPSG